MQEAVQRLASLMGVSLSRDDRGGHPWRELERRLGLDLPGEYKSFADEFPRGLIQGIVRVIRPGEDPDYEATDYLGYYSHRLEDMRVREREIPGSIPYPIYPDVGGVLPWGDLSDGSMLFWLTRGVDQNSWPVVYCDGDFSNWTESDQGMIEVLIDLVTDHPDPPFLRPPKKPKPPTGKWRRDFWVQRAKGKTGPRDPEGWFAQLLTCLEVAGAPLRTQGYGVDWGPITNALHDLQLPPDYREFIERVGGGIFCGIRIFAPYSADPEFDLLSNAKKIGERSAANPIPELRELSPPFYPVPGGSIPFGVDATGAVLAWAPSDDDSRSWGFVRARSKYLAGYTYIASLSFSEYLVRHARDDVMVLFGIDGWSGPPSFQPETA